MRILSRSVRTQGFKRERRDRPHDAHDAEDLHDSADVVELKLLGRSLRLFVEKHRKVERHDRKEIDDVESRFEELPLVW